MTYYRFLKKAIFILTGLYLCQGFIAPVLSVSPAYAMGCGAEYEVMTRLRSPSFGSYNVWSGTYGAMRGDERIIGGELLSDGYLMLAAQTPKDAGGDQLTLLEMDRRGRVVWEAAHEIKGLKTVRHMMRLGTHFVVTADVKVSQTRDQVWIGFFNDKGTLLRTRLLKDPKLSLSADAITGARGGSSFHMAVAKTNPKTGEKFSILYHLDGKGRTLSTRSYRLGDASRILGLQKTSDGGLIATGWSSGRGDRHDGWVLQLDSDMKLVWQQTISRGGQAHLYHAAQISNGNVIVVGDVVSADGAQQAAFVFMMDGRSSEVMWQRYYKDDHKITARQIMPHTQNMSGDSYSILLDSTEKQTLETDEFARVLQVNERGEILDSKNLFYGHGAHGLVMFSGYNDERIVVGAADMVKTDNAAGDDMSEEAAMIKSKDGLVLAVPAPSLYSDPCRAKTAQ